LIPLDIVFSDICQVVGIFCGIPPKILAYSTFKKNLGIKGNVLENVAL